MFPYKILLKPFFFVVSNKIKLPGYFVVAVPAGQTIIRAVPAGRSHIVFFFVCVCVTDGRVFAKGASCLNGAQHATAAVAMPLQRRRYPHLIDTQSTLLLYNTMR